MLKGFFKWLAGVIAAVALLFLIAFITVSALTDTEPVVADNSYLYIPLSGSISEYLTPDPLAGALGRSVLDIKKIRDVLEKAQVDERVNGVVLQIEMLQTGYAKIQELRNLIQNFRQSGKPIFALLGPDMAFTKDYYVASACDSVFMPPSANLFLTGVSTEITFYKAFFKKFGVHAEFAQIGKYKNSPDVYTRSSMSKPHREVMTDILNRLYADLVATIAQSRRLSKTEVEHLINDFGGFTGREALKAGLIDRTGYLPDFVQSLGSSHKKPARLSAIDYAGVPASSLKIRNKSRIAVINCVGVIAGGSDSNNPYFGKMMGSETVVKNLEKAAKSKFIKAIILRIDSPGGSATASEAIWHAIRKAREKKPVIASVSDYGASGGYYISMAADTMIAAPNSLVGSIGIFAGKFSFKGVYDKLGLNSETIQNGKNAGLFSVMQPWSKSERKIIDRLIADFYRDFVRKAAEARQMTFEQVDGLARGHVWTGAEAVENHLFDSRGYFYNAVNAAMEMAHIDSAESVRLIYYPKEKSMLDELFNTFSIFAFNTNPLDKLRGVLQRIQNKPLALLPFAIKWN